MTERPLLLLMSGLLGCAAFGEPVPDAPSPAEVSTEIQAPAETETPPELAETIREHDAAMKTLEQQDAAALATLRDSYAASLDTMRQEAVSQGDLDHVIAIDFERQRIENEITPEEKAKLFYTLRELRGRYDRERAEQMRHATSEVRAGLQRYAVALDHLAGMFLQAGNVHAAHVVERARLSMLGARPTTACATSYPSTGSSTAAESGSGSAGTSRHHSESSSKAGAKPTVAGSTTMQGKSGASVAAANTPAEAVKGKPPAAPEKSVAAKSAPAATSVSAPTKVAKDTPKSATKSSGKGGTTASRSGGTRSSGGSAPASHGAPAGGQVIVVR